MISPTKVLRAGPASLTLDPLGGHQREVMNAKL